MCIMTLFHKNKLFVNSIKSTCCSVSSRTCCKNKLESEIRKLVPPNDNASAHSNLSVYEFLAKNKTTVMPCPPYSPHLVQWDFFLFPKLKLVLRGRRFTDIMIQAKLQNPFDNVSNNRLYKMFPTVASLVGLLHEVPIRLHEGDNID